MFVLNQQLHGYRHGHELLSTSTALPKSDQALIDRLSDIAGSLSPGEKFEPYLTCYPLPSGSHYVVARTWQDLDAPRAGCVRTRSLLVPMSAWVNALDITGLMRVATAAGPKAPAEAVDVDASVSEPLPPVDKQRGMELLEAIFLEDREPIVVFDADQPELITARLLTAFWPGLRRNFSVSTFARSPRMIQKQSFDLVFAPKDSRSRFGDWKGRRIDGRKADNGRHRWSAAIAERVFASPTPSLRALDTLGEMSADTQGSEAALRIALLWDELLSKLGTSPNAALGLLDIANTRPTRSVEAIRALGPALARSARQATMTMPAGDAWRFLAAMTDKLRNRHLAKSIATSIRGSAVELAASHPTETVALLPDLMGTGQRELLLGAAGDGIAQVLDRNVSNHLSELDDQCLLELVMASPPLMEGVLTSYPEFSTSLGVALAGADDVRRTEAGRRMLRFLVDDSHVDLAGVLFANLDTLALAEEVRHLHAVNRLESSGLRDLIIRSAEVTGGLDDIREAAVALGDDDGAAALVDALVKPNAYDLRWLLLAGRLSAPRRHSMLVDLVHRASIDQLRTMLSDETLVGLTLDVLFRDVASTGDALLKIARYAQLLPETFIDLVIRIIPYLERRDSSDLAEKALEVLLPRDLGGSSSNLLGDLLTVLAGGFNAAKVFRLSVQRGVPGAIASRNLIAFNVSPPHIRKKFIGAVEAMAAALVDRSRIDITQQAADAAASLLWDSHQGSPLAYLKASAALLPSLMRFTMEPVSPLIAAAFPPVYRELQRESLPDFMGFVFIFLDWDKCKSARRTLVDAFLRSEWRAIDIALAAVRSGDGLRILNQMSRQSGGDTAIEAIERDLLSIPSPWQAQVKAALQELRGDDHRKAQ